MTTHLISIVCLSSCSTLIASLATQSIWNLIWWHVVRRWANVSLVSCHLFCIYKTLEHLECAFVLIPAHSVLSVSTWFRMPVTTQILNYYLNIEAELKISWIKYTTNLNKLMKISSLWRWQLGKPWKLGENCHFLVSKVDRIFAHFIQP